MNDNLRNIKTFVDNPYFNASKWNLSIDQIETITNFFKKINSKFNGIYQRDNIYNLGSYVFIDDDLFELSKESSQHFSLVTNEFLNNKHINLFKLNIESKLYNVNKDITYNDNTYNFIVNNYDTDEVLCIKDKNAILYNKTSNAFEPINIVLDSNIASACFDNFSFYFGLNRSIIQKSKTIDNIEHQKIFNYSFLIKSIACNDEYLLALLSDNTIEVINRKNPQERKNYSTGKYFTEKVKLLFVDKYKIFISEKNKIYSFVLKDKNLSFVSEMIIPNINEVTNIESFFPYILINSKDGKTLNCKSTVYPTIKSDLNSILNKNSLIKEDVYSYIIPEYNLNDSINLSLLTKETTTFIKNKGIEVNTNKTKYKVKDEFLNKTIFISIETTSNSNNINVRPTTKTISTISIKENGKLDLFIDIKDNDLTVYIFKDKNFISKNKFHILPSISNENSIEFFTLDSNTYLLKKLVVFNNIISSIEKDRIISNEIYLPIINNYTEFLPYSNVSTYEFGVAKIKFSNQSLMTTNQGLKVNSSNLFEETIKPIDEEVLFNLKGAKLLFDKTKNNLSNSINNLAPLTHKHNWSDIEKVPNADEAVKGVVLLTNDSNDQSADKAATPYFVKSIERSLINQINLLSTGKILEFKEEVDYLSNKVLPKLKDEINTQTKKMQDALRNIEIEVNSPKDFLNKNIGGIVNADVTIRNINFGNNVIAFDKTNNNQLSIQFGPNASIKHGPSSNGIDTFMIGATQYQNDNSGGIDIGYLKNGSFFKTAYIASSGASSFNKVYSAGDITTNSNINVNGDIFVLSDKRFKTDIKLANNPLDKILKLNGYTYYKNNSNKIEAGVLAQEVLESIPELVNEENGIYKVNYNGFHAYYIEAIKALVKEIQDLNIKQKKLEEELKDLR